MWVALGARWLAAMTVGAVAMVGCSGSHSVTDGRSPATLSTSSHHSATTTTAVTSVRQTMPSTALSTPSRTTVTLTPTTATTPHCSDQQFTAATVTDHSSYTRGQTVNIAVTMTNSGPTCNGIPPWYCGQSASAYNSSGADVWDWGAGPDSPQDVKACPAAVNQPVPHGSSSSESMYWRQDRCTFDGQGPVVPNPDCPGIQVPGGTYTVVADRGKAPAISIAISG